MKRIAIRYSIVKLGLLFTLLHLLTCSPLTFSQTPDSIPETSLSADSLSFLTDDYANEIENDFSPGLALFALFSIGFMFICIGVGIVLTIIGLLILFGLVGAGILSASMLIGLHNKSFEKGFKTFLVSVTSFGGLFIGACGFWLLNTMVHWFTTKNSLIIGSVGGLLTGFLFGIIVFYILRKLTKTLKDNIRISNFKR